MSYSYAFMMSQNKIAALVGAFVQKNTFFG